MIFWRSKPDCITKSKIMEKAYNEGVLIELGLPILPGQGVRLDENGQLRFADSNEDGYTIKDTRCSQSIQDINREIQDLIISQLAFGFPFPNDIGQQPCLFLDRDGILIKDVGYPHKIKDLEFIPETLELIQAAKIRNYKVIVITNQAGLAKRVFSEQQYLRFTSEMKNQLRNMHLEIDDIFYCPWHPKGDIYKRDSLFRKPHPGMILSACEKYSLDLTKSLMVGDKDSDKIQIDGLQSIVIQGQYPLDHTPTQNLSDLHQLINMV